MSFVVCTVQQQLHCPFCCLLHLLDFLEVEVEEEEEVTVEGVDLGERGDLIILLSSATMTVAAAAAASAAAEEETPLGIWRMSSGCSWCVGLN
jgi:hypothetical protein